MRNIIVCGGIIQVRKELWIVHASSLHSVSNKTITQYRNLSSTIRSFLRLIYLFFQYVAYPDLNYDVVIFFFKHIKQGRMVQGLNFHFPPFERGTSYGTVKGFNKNYIHGCWKSNHIRQTCQEAGTIAELFT